MVYLPDGTWQSAIVTGGTTAGHVCNQIVKVWGCFASMRVFTLPSHTLTLNYQRFYRVSVANPLLLKPY